MSAFKDTLYEIQEAIQMGELSFAEIAVLYGVSLRDVELIHEEICDQIEFDRDAYVADNDYYDTYDY